MDMICSSIHSAKTARTRAMNRSNPQCAILTILLHHFLLVRKSDSHLLQRYLIQGAGYFKTLGLLVFLKAVTSVGVELAGLLTVVKAALFENRLSLFDLIGSRAKDRLSARVRRLVTARRPVRVLVSILILRCRRQRERQ